jgi:hypothetical protein
MEKLRAFSQTFGLHPLTALGLLAIDWMLFGEEVATAGVGWVISLPVGAVLAIVVFLIQKHSYRDATLPALSKGLLVGLLTAIPAPLSSFGLLPMAAFGALKALSTKPQETLQRQ